eukprot:1698357-Pyramimonas_sp.AAC.1
MLGPKDIAEHFDLVDEADRKEIKQLAEAHVWKPISIGRCSRNPVDCAYVRKWTQIKVGSELKWIVKNRLCARGFLDSQGAPLSTKAPTATRLSQQLPISLAASTTSRLRAGTLQEHS